MTEDVLAIMNAEESKVAPAAAHEISYIARVVELMVEAVQWGQGVSYRSRRQRTYGDRQRYGRLTRLPRF